MRVSFRILALAAIVGLLCGDAVAQADLGVLTGLYQDLRSNDPRIRFKAAQIIRGTDEYLKAPESADRLLAFLDLERREIRRLYLSGEGYEGWSEQYSEIGYSTWALWKDRLNPQAFRVFAEGGYNSSSRFAKELGARAGRFVAELLPLTSVNRERGDEYTRENAVALVGCALAEAEKGTVPLNVAERAALIQSLTKAALDSEPGPRWEVVRVLKLAGGVWAIPMLNEMYEREQSFDPTGSNWYTVQQARAEMKSAIEAIRSRAEKPAAVEAK